jgi:3-oxoadipate enol-lactonase
METNVSGLAVFTYGEPSALPVVMVHGFPYSSNMWRNQVGALRESYYCVAYDTRGLGRSAPGDGQFTLEALVDDLFAVMAALDLRKPVLCGLSMGGYTALRAAEREPQRFRGLILCDTRSGADADAGRIRRAELIKKINTEGMEGFAAGMVAATFAEDAAVRIPDVYQAALAEARSQNPLGVKGCLLAMASRTDTTAFLARIRVPVLLVVGEKDSLTPVEEMRAMQQKIAGARLVVVPDAGHMAPLESPAFVTRAMQDFLGQF